MPVAHGQIKPQVRPRVRILTRYRQSAQDGRRAIRRASDRAEGTGGAMGAELVKWSEVKAKARELDPRSEAEREAGAAVARQRREAYVRGHQLSEMRKVAGRPGPSRQGAPGEPGRGLPH